MALSNRPSDKSEKISASADFEGSKGVVSRTEHRIVESLEKIHFAPQESIRDVLMRLGYGTWPEYSDFKGKKILDVGGGFSKVATVLRRDAAIIDIADPIFIETDFWKILERDVATLEKNRDMTAALLLKPASPKEIVNKNLLAQNRTLEEARAWLDFKERMPENVKLLPYRAEKLQALRWARYDYAFANHVLSKSHCDESSAIFQIRHCLKPNGLLIVTDNMDAAEGKFTDSLETAIRDVGGTEIHEASNRNALLKVFQFS